MHNLYIWEIVVQTFFDLSNNQMSNEKRLNSMVDFLSKNNWLIGDIGVQKIWWMMKKNKNVIYKN